MRIIDLLNNPTELLAFTNTSEVLTTKQKHSLTLLAKRCNAATRSRNVVTTSKTGVA